MDQIYKFSTIEEVYKLANIELPLMYDSETIGLYGKIRLAQFYQPHFDKVLVIEYPDTMQLAALLNKYIIVCHNAHYDISTVQENLGMMKWMPKEFHCTFLLSRLHFYTKEEFSFDKVITYVLGYDPYDGNKKAFQSSDWSIPVLSEGQLNYAASDVMHMQTVWDVVKEELENINYRLDLLTTRYCLDFQNNGMPVDEEKLNQRYKENMTRLAEIALPINCNSYQQVRAYINSSLSDDIGLATLESQGNEKAAAVREARKLTKNNSFLTKFSNTLRDGNIYGKFKCSPRSGRLSSDDQNLQQIPRSLKTIFGVDTDSDQVILFADYPQIQLRGVCVVTGDVTMERLFREGDDLHNYVARIIFGENFTKEQRQICKTANFGLLFGAGVPTFQAILLKQAGMSISEAEGLRIKKLWLSLWKQVAQWQEAGIKAWKKKQIWETPLGRRYTAKMMTDQLAMQIQGFEAEVAKLALHYMYPKLDEIDPTIEVINFIHDSYILKAPKDEEIYKASCVVIADCMQEAWFEMSKSVAIKDLPMPINVKVGYNWGDIENKEFIYEYDKA